MSNLSPDHPAYDSLLQSIQLLHAIHPPKPSWFGVADMVMKIAVAICTAGILWLVTSVSDLQNQMTALTIKQSVTEKALARLDAFTQQPRFTYEDFQSRLAPIAQKVEHHQELLAERHAWVQNAESRLARLENHFEMVLDRLDEMTGDMKALRVK